MSRANHYTPLPSSSEQPVNDTSLPHEKANSRLFYWTCVLTICTSLLSAFLLTFGPSFIDSTSRHPSPKLLRRPNQYINLEKVLNSTTHQQPFPSFVDFPPVLLQINTSDSLRSLHEDDRGWLSYVGSVYPDDRHFVVSSKTSTIAQFRHHDYGMERCVLSLSIPEPTKILDPAVQINDFSDVDVWLLESEAEFSPYVVWDRAPARRSLFMRMRISKEGQSDSLEFHCASGAFLTLEFACSPSQLECYVDFWQNKEEPYGGVRITQSDSLVG